MGHSRHGAVARKVIEPTGGANGGRSAEVGDGRSRKGRIAGGGGLGGSAAAAPQKNKTKQARNTQRRVGGALQACYWWAMKDLNLQPMD